jgi:hypothetical protein
MKIRTFLEAEDTTLQRFRKRIDYVKKSSKRRVQMADDPLDKIEIADTANKEVKDTEKKIDTLKKGQKPPANKTGIKKQQMGENVMVDEREIKAALDAFENDDFITAKEKLKGQIVQAKEDYLKGKLGLEKSLSAAPVTEEMSGHDHTVAGLQQDGYKKAKKNKPGHTTMMHPKHGTAHVSHASGETHFG